MPNGQARALGCMARIQVVAERVTDWLDVALAWHEDFDDPDPAGQCLALAEGKAGYDPDAWEHAKVVTGIAAMPAIITGREPGNGHCRQHTYGRRGMHPCSGSAGGYSGPNTGGERKERLCLDQGPSRGE